MRFMCWESSILVISPCQRRGARVLAEECGQSVETFCKTVVSHTRKKITEAIIAFIVSHATGRNEAHMALEQENDFFSTTVKLALPIVGFGAAAVVLLPKVAKRLETKVIFPPRLLGSGPRSSIEAPSKIMIADIGSLKLCLTNKWPVLLF